MGAQSGARDPPMVSDKEATDPMGDQSEAGDIPMVPVNMKEATDPMADQSQVGDVPMVPEDKEATDPMADQSEVLSCF